MLAKPYSYFNYHDCTLEKIEQTENAIIIFLLPRDGILSDINHICFYHSKICRNDLSTNDFGQSTWLESSTLQKDGIYEVSITFRNKNEENRILTVQYDKVDIITDDVTEQKILLDRAKSDGRLFRFLVAQSNLRIAKRWANSKFFSDTIIPQLISNMVRNAILSLSDFGQTTSYSLEELEHLKKAISDICDFKKYTLLFNVCIAFKMSKEMRFTKEECSFFIELSSDFLSDVKSILKQKKVLI